MKIALAYASSAIQLIKGGSSKWIHDTFPNYNNFKWQEGYGAFSVSSSQIKNTIACINAQKEHLGCIGEQQRSCDQPSQDIISGRICFGFGRTCN